MAKQAEITLKHYQKNFKKYGVDPKSLSWGSRGAAHQRFRAMWKEIDFNGKSVLDVGCGFGEMAKFLHKRYEGVKYTGVDIVPEFVAQAKKDHPYYEFMELDYFSNPLKEKFDVVMASGTLNSQLNKGNMEFRKKAIKVMFEHSKKACIFNMLGGHPQPETPEDSNIWYADSLEILEYCMSLTRRVVLRAEYHPKDFTIVMYPVKV
jgi:SAM-dependent methyltransferase